jgi:hypothetical protein
MEVARSTRLAGPPTASSRVLGVLGIIGGLVLIAAFIPDLPWSNASFNLRLVLFNAGAIAVVLAVHRRQAVISRRLSFVATVPAFIANAWYLVMVILSIGRPQFPEPDPEFRPIFFYAAIALWLTDAVFGFVAARIGVVWWWAALALGIGSLLALTGVGGLGFTTGPFATIVEPLALWGIVLVGIGWVLLGVDIATRSRPTAVSAALEAPGT